MSSYGVWLSAAGMKVSDHRQTLLANNIANGQTTGFKHDMAVIRQRPVESRVAPDGLALRHPVLDGLAGGVDVRPTQHSTAQGPIEHTGRALDVAIEGEGFFTVSDGEATRYTRNGSFALNRDGELILGGGDGRWRVLDDNGAVIRIDPAAGTPSVSQDGTIRQGEDGVARLGLRASPDPQVMRKIGETLFEAVGGDVQPAAPRLVAGALEGSNFNIVQGLAEMIEATRAFQMNATLLQMQDQATDRAVNTVGRLA